MKTLIIFELPLEAVVEMEKKILLSLVFFANRKGQIVIFRHIFSPCVCGCALDFFLFKPSRAGEQTNRDQARRRRRSH